MKHYVQHIQLLEHDFLLEMCLLLMSKKLQFSRLEAWNAKMWKS
jgi:hypothetical protein